MDKQQLIDQLTKLIKSRSGIQFCDYFTGDYRESLRVFNRDRYEWRVDGEQALKMLRFIELRDSITGDDILRHANKGRRLSYDFEARKFEYIPYQLDSEVRSAVARLCASVLWDYFRDSGYKTAEEIRKAAKGYFKATIANRFFN